MRKLVSLTMAAAITLSCAGAAVADSQPTPPPANGPTQDQYKVLLDQYKKDRDTYMAAMQDRAAKFRAINQVFSIAMRKATTDAQAALKSATTPEQKSSIVNSQKLVIATAITARDLSIAALGPEPTAPIEPARPPKDQAGKGSKVKSGKN